MQQQMMLILSSCKPSCAYCAGTRQLVMSCCAFGNSLTLPLVFLLALLPSAAADRATGYLALFMMGWSPMLWSFGLQLLGRSMPPSQPGNVSVCKQLPVAWHCSIKNATGDQLLVEQVSGYLDGSIVRFAASQAPGNGCEEVLHSSQSPFCYLLYLQ